MAVNASLGDALRSIHGYPVSSIEFVQDYIQVHFDGPTLTTYTLPTVTTGVGTLGCKDVGYRDSLCALIGIQLKDSNVIAGQEMMLVFENGCELRISLDKEDHGRPEALQFQGVDGLLWVA